MKRVLAVDDDAQCRILLKGMLQKQGYAVQVCANGSEALEAALAAPPDLLMTDAMMPVMDGFELCRRFKSDQRLRTIPIVLFTGHFNDAESEALALTLGAYCFVTKPWNTEALEQLIAQAIKPDAELSSPASESECSANDSHNLRRHHESVIQRLEKSQSALQVERGSFRTVCDALPVEIMVLDAQCNVVWANRAACDRLDLHGVPEAQAARCGDYLGCLRRFEGEHGCGGGPSCPECPAFTAVRAVLAEKRVFHLEFSVRKSSDEASDRRHFLANAASIIFDGDPSAVLALIDITERKTLEDQLRQAHKMESVGRLAGGVAHDFNNLLMGIVGYAEMALEKLGGAPVREELDEIVSLANRSAALTRQLLAFARKQTIAPQILDLNDAAASALKMLRRMIGEDVVLALTPGSAIYPIMMDPCQIEQILVNLCINARDAIGGIGSITIRTANATLDEKFCASNNGCKPGHYAMLEVRDDGCGMTPETMKHVFEPFFTTKASGEGTGLGLATVYGIVKQNDGYIRVQSAPGKGTTFEIYLPRIEKTRQMVETVEEKSPVAAGGVESILLVEDEAGVRIPTAHHLEQLGYTVLAAATPQEALRMAREHDGPIHLLLTDVVMPGMNGRDLAITLADEQPDIQCFYISGYTADVIARRGILEQDMELLQKPFSKNELAQRLRLILDGRQPVLRSEK